MAAHEPECDDGTNGNRAEPQRLYDASRLVHGALLARIVEGANRESDPEAALEAGDD